MNKDTDEVVARVLTSGQLRDLANLSEAHDNDCFECHENNVAMPTWAEWLRIKADDMERAAALAPQEGENVLTTPLEGHASWCAQWHAPAFRTMRNPCNCGKEATPPAAPAEPTVKNMNLFTGPGYIGPTHEPDISLAAAPAGAQPWDARVWFVEKFGGASAPTSWELELAFRAHAAGKTESGGGDAGGGAPRLAANR